MRHLTHSLQVRVGVKSLTVWFPGGVRPHRGRPLTLKGGFMKWEKPSGLEIETNDEPVTIEKCESLGWKQLEGEVETVEITKDEMPPEAYGGVPPESEATVKA